MTRRYEEITRRVVLPKRARMDPNGLFVDVVRYEPRAKALPADPFDGLNAAEPSNDAITDRERLDRFLTIARRDSRASQVAYRVYGDGAGPCVDARQLSLVGG
jgi:hypothetical protein